MSNELMTTGTAYMPVMGVEDAIQRRDAIVSFTRKVMTQDVDFGSVGGTGKPTLLKPGAEKLCTLFGLTPTFEILESELDWTGERHNGEPFFYFFYRCKMWRGDALIAVGDGSCNSMEKKYRYRWVGSADVPEGIDKSQLKTQGGKVSEFTFSINAQDRTQGKYGKPDSYWKPFEEAIANKTARLIKKKTKTGKEFDAWEIDAVLYQLPNPDVADQVNTIQKMAQKRSLIASTLIAVNASEFFTQDMEDFAVDPDGAFEGSFVVRKVERESDQNPIGKATPQASEPQAPAQPIDHKPVRDTDRAAVSALLDALNEARDVVAKLGATPTEEQKRAFAAKFRELVTAINAQLDLRGLPLITETKVTPALAAAQRSIDAMIGYDEKAPLMEAQTA